MLDSPSTSSCSYTCPACGKVLQPTGEIYECVACQRQFPVHEGIPDLRVEGNEAESTFYEEVSFDHHYDFSQRDQWYFRDQDHFADQVGFLLRVRELRAFLARAYGDAEKELTILDAGCGDGIMAQFLLRRSDHIYCVDLSLNSLKKARKFLSSSNMDTPKSVHFARCDVHALPFPDSFFDVVVLTEVLEHTSKPDSALLEVYRTLKLCGEFYITTPNKHGSGLLYGPLKRLSTRLGMRLEETRRYYREIEEAEARHAIKGHVREFTVDELRTLLAEVGFSTLRSYTQYPLFLDLQMVSKALRGLDRGIFPRWCARICAGLNQLISSWVVGQRRGFIHICWGQRSP